ncbi:MAG TPA: penicillin-binding protein 2 [Patescibacteria group bacterium]|jgi:penicillin-binding protein 2
MKDPFGTDKFLSLDFDTSYGEAEQWQGALKNEEGADTVARERSGDAARTRFFVIAILVLFLILVTRLMVLQIFGAAENAALAEGNRVRSIEIAAPRGVIYDAKGGIVARNTPNFEVRVVPIELPRQKAERERAYRTLSEPLQLSPAEVRKRAEEKGLDYGQPVLIADGLPRENSVLLRLRATDLPGVVIQNNPRRQYADTDLYAHLLGYVGKVSAEDLKKDQTLRRNDYVGKSGLERVYQGQLSGEPGERRLEVDAQGEVIKELQSNDPVPGRSVQLGIDPKLQKVMHDAVDNGIKSSRRGLASGGSAIALDPKTGTVLGMVSLPSFDNNDFVDGVSQAKYKELSGNPDKPLFNRPISGEYPPGSTFKIVTVAGALAEGVVSPDDYLASPPSIDVGGAKFVDWKEDGHGSVNAARALAVSSDVYIYKVSGGFEGESDGLGVDKLGDYMRQFGIGTPTGVDLPDEQDGLVPSPSYKKAAFDEDWYIGNTYQMGIGQGFVLATPLQVATYTAAIANDGIAYKPHLAKAFLDSANKRKRTAVEPEPLVNLKVDREVIETVQQGMRDAVDSGTAVDLKDMPVDVCGKTGSAEFANETNAHAWFTAYAPCDDPRIVLTVMIEGGGEGSDVAVPAAKRIFESFFDVQAPSPKPSPGGGD